MDARVISRQFFAIPKSPFLRKRRMHAFVHISIGVFVIYGIAVSSNSLVFHTFGVTSSNPAAFQFLIFLSIESSSSCVNCPSLMSSCLLIILEIGSCVTFVSFPSKFSKCCFHRCIHSSWLVVFSLSFAMLFLLLTSFTVCFAILDCLSSNEFLILLI